MTGAARRFGALGGLALLLIVTGAANAAELTSLGGATAVEIVDGETLAFDDGRRVRLVGIEAPRPLGRPGNTPSPLAEKAMAALRELALGQAVELRSGGSVEDRHGRILAHLYRADGLWIQGEMLRRGLARVHTFPDNRALAPEMLELELAARAARRGIWAHPFYAVRTIDEARRHIDSFQLVEGRVLKAARVRNQVFLNFGEDWRTDFTVRIERRALRLFREATLDPLALEGHRIRIRGWLESYDGPMIEATHPEQIELLDP